MRRARFRGNILLNDSILIGCIYRSPNSSNENTKKMYDLLSNDYIKTFKKVCIVVDFNISSIKWDVDYGLWMWVWTGIQDNALVGCIRGATLIQLGAIQVLRNARGCGGEGGGGGGGVTQRYVALHGGGGCWY